MIKNKAGKQEETATYSYTSKGETEQIKQWELKLYATFNFEILYPILWDFLTGENLDETLTSNWINVYSVQEPNDTRKPILLKHVFLVKIIVETTYLVSFIF